MESIAKDFSKYSLWLLSILDTIFHSYQGKTKTIAKLLNISNTHQPNTVQGRVLSSLQLNPVHNINKSKNLLH